MPNSPANKEKVRDHLANERTFLAWVRTSIALLGFGVVIVKLRFLTPGLPVSPSGAGPILAAGEGGRSLLLGLLFCAVGVVTLGFAVAAYCRTRSMIDAETYQPLQSGMIVFAAVIGLLAAGCIALLFKLG